MLDGKETTQDVTEMGEIDHGDLVQEKLTELNLNKYQKNNKI